MFKLDFKKEKYIKIILYIISRCTHKENLGKTIISVLLYFIDFNYYELYGESLTNEVYLKSRIGIVPKHFNEIMNQLIRSHNLYYRQEVYYYYLIKKYYIRQIPLFNFTKDEQRIISDFSATDLLIYQRGDMPYRLVDLDEELDYNHVFYRDELYSVRKY